MAPAERGLHLRLEDLATEARRLITVAEAAGVEVNDGNVVDLIADNVRDPLDTIRAALVVAGYGRRFPNATASRR